MPTHLKNDERVLIDDGPHMAFIFTQMWRQLVVMLIAWGAFRWLHSSTGEPVYLTLSWVPIWILGLRFVLGLVDWFARRHVLTENSISITSGILRRVSVEIPLSRVQHSILVQPIGERIMGLGSIGITSAGTGSIDLVWRGVEHPGHVLDTIKAQVQRMSSHGQGKQVTPVIGIVGGIGAGKSTVAGIFEELGCEISDSDASVREILTEPEIMDTLKMWWGKQVFAPDGTIDRSSIAKIVFGSDADRRKLEGLIHPRVHDKRHEQIRHAREQGVAGVVVDAPLLYEAGVDHECDAVVFVDTPREIRLQRVKTNRGWGESELNRRENAQLTLEQKRKRSDYIVSNSGLPDELHGRVSRVLASIQKDLRQRQTSEEA